MAQSWRVERHNGYLVELERDGEVLEIELPDETGARLNFTTLCAGQVVADDMVRSLIGMVCSK